MPHHAPSVTTTVSSKKGKQLIPWREPSKGYALRVAMYRLAIVEQIYFKQQDDKRKVDDRWLDFATKLFAQPEFLGMEGSFRTVKDQYYATLNERAKHHGWMDANGGTTGNLSNHAGELDALDQLIKNCMMDKEQLENEKQLAKDLSKELNTKETDIIQGQLAKEAKESRKENSLKCEDVLMEVTLDIVINAFCCDGVGTEPNPKEFKAEMESYGMKKLDAHKLSMYLRDASEKSFEQWALEHENMDGPSLLDSFVN